MEILKVTDEELKEVAAPIKEMNGAPSTAKYHWTSDFIDGLMSIKETLVDQEETIEDLSEQLSAFELHVITQDAITTFSQLKQAINLVEENQTPSQYVLYIAEAIYDTNNCIICFPLINGVYDKIGAYCYRQSIPSYAEAPEFNFFAFRGTSDDYVFTIPAGSRMLRWVLKDGNEV